MRRAARIVEAMHARIFELVEPGLPKNRLIAEIYHTAINGAEGHVGDYPAIVPLLPSGIDASAPHLTWDERPFQAGEGTFFEIAGCYRRYHCPLSRTVFLGEPPQKFRDVEQAVLEGMEAALATARPGNARGRRGRLAPDDRAPRHREGEPLRLPDRAQLPAGLGRADDEPAPGRQVGAAGEHDLRPDPAIPGNRGPLGLEITEKLVVTATGAEPFCSYPRKLLWSSASRGRAPRDPSPGARARMEHWQLGHLLVLQSECAGAKPLGSMMMAQSEQVSGPGLLERLAAGPVICAEGYLFELERRGWLQAGPYVPEVVLDAPDAVRQLHREFVRAGSDVVEAFTYYGHREKLKVIGKEEILEPLNRQALQIAKEVADESGCLLAAISRTPTSTTRTTRQSFRFVRALVRGAGRLGARGRASTSSSARRSAGSARR